MKMKKKGKRKLNHIGTVYGDSTHGGGRFKGVK